MSKATLWPMPSLESPIIMGFVRAHSAWPKVPVKMLPVWGLPSSRYFLGPFLTRSGSTRSWVKLRSRGFSPGR